MKPFLFWSCQRSALETVSSFVLPKEEMVSNFRRRKGACRRVSWDLRMPTVVRDAVFRRRIDFPRLRLPAAPPFIKAGHCASFGRKNKAPFRKGSLFDANDGRTLLPAHGGARPVEMSEAPPVADEASEFRGSAPLVAQIPGSHNYASAP